MYKTYRQGKLWRDTSVKDLINRLSINDQLSWWSTYGSYLRPLHETIIHPVLLHIFKQEFIWFLKDLGYLTDFSTFTISDSANKWRSTYMGIDVQFDSFDEYLTYMSPLSYVRYAWCWSHIKEIKGGDLEYRWMNKVREILGREFKF